MSLEAPLADTTKMKSVLLGTRTRVLAISVVVPLCAEIEVIRPIDVMRPIEVMRPMAVI